MSAESNESIRQGDARIAFFSLVFFFTLFLLPSSLSVSLSFSLIRNKLFRAS